MNTKALVPKAKGRERQTSRRRFKALSRLAARGLGKGQQFGDYQIGRIFLNVMAGIGHAGHVGMGEIAQPHAIERFGFESDVLHRPDDLDRLVGKGRSQFATLAIGKIADRSFRPRGIWRGKARIPVRDDQVGCGAR